MLLGLAEGTEIVGPVISVLVSRDLTSYPRVSELALLCCRWRAAPLMLSPGRYLHPEAPQSCMWTIVQITPHSHGQWKKQRV